MTAGVPGLDTGLSGIAPGSPGFRRVTWALFVAGFTTFAVLYHVQPLMPLLADGFQVGPAQAALSLSFATGFLSVSLLLAGALADRFGRKPVMVASLALSGLLTLATALIPSWTGLLIARALLGVALAGLPAVAMAYLGEEMRADALPRAMGQYIAGTAMGGMVGRLGTGVVVDFLPWQVAAAGIGVLGLAASLVVWRYLPISTGFHPQRHAPSGMVRALIAPLRHPGLRALFALAFLLMGSFVTLYNYIGFRLLASPFTLSQSAIGLIFSAYLLGMGSSSRVGQLVGHWGRGPVLITAILVMASGVALTLPDAIAPVVGGIAILTFGFFAAHTVASGWVGALAPSTGKAQASSLYLFTYYMGSSLMGAAGGIAWADALWPGVIALIAMLLGLSLVLAARLTVLDRRG